MIREFQSELGAQWEKYHESLTLFLVGKLSRPELVRIIKPLLHSAELVKYHNKLLLLNLANLAVPGDSGEFLSEIAMFWSKSGLKSGAKNNVKSSQYEKFKSNIMGLPLKERRRIRLITKESGKKNKLSAFVTLTRQALLPKIPMILDKDQQQLQVNNLVSWQQDVVNGINTPVATTSYELPDMDTLLRRVLMTMREHGLVGGLSLKTLEIISLGLETHLKNILELAIDIVRYREQKYASNSFLLPGVPSANSKASVSLLEERPTGVLDVVLSVEDLYNTFEMFPHMIEPCGPKIRLSSVLLKNDDERDPKLPQPEEVGRNERNDAMGTSDELKWMLQDLITT